MKQGQSELTPRKEYDLNEILHYLFSVHRAILRKHDYLTRLPFLYCDINCGSGENTQVGCEGSPSVFMRAMSHFSFKVNAYFVDIEKERTDELKRTIVPAPWVNVICGDHAEILPVIVNGSKRGSHGLIYHDPNGMPSLDLLERVFQDRNAKSVDVLIRLNATVIKRCRTAWPDRGYECLSDMLGRISKKNWLIQEPQSVHQFSFLLGSNFSNLSELKKIGMHLLDSGEGQAIFDKLNLTKNEIEYNHPRLPYETYDEYLAHPEYRKIRAQAIARAAGKCEICGIPINGNTNVHHVKYPAWGTFEQDASGLLAICYDCHCHIHEKEA